MAEITKISLVKTRSPRGRMYLIRDGKGLGAAGHPPGHYTWDWVIGCGVDRGDGYQGYIAVDYALTCEWVPEDAKATIRRTLNIPEEIDMDANRLLNRVTAWSPDTGEEILIAAILTADAAMDFVKARRAKHPQLIYRINGHEVAE